MVYNMRLVEVVLVAGPLGQVTLQVTLCMVYNMRLVEVVLVAGPLGQVTLCMVYNTRLVEVVLVAWSSWSGHPVHGI